MEIIHAFLRQKRSSQFLQIGVILLVITLPFLITQVQKVQQIDQKAQTSDSFTVNVLAIGFNPIEGNRNVAETYFGMQGMSADEAEDYIFNNAISTFRRLSNNTINYQVVDKRHITSFPRYTNNYNFTLDNYKECVWGRPEFNPQKCENQKHSFDHQAWLADNSICEIANEVDADEVWVVSLPYVMTWESFMFGPRDTFAVNGPIIKASQCNKNYVLMDATYDSLDNFMHIYGHRIESFMAYLTASWKSSDRQKYWLNFSSTNRYSLPNGSYSQPTCGNAHYPANANAGYDFSNTTTKSFTCPDWANFPNINGETETINCNAWGCNDKGWQEHWMGSMPQNDGETNMISNTGISFTFRNNWWYYILFPENAIEQKKRQTTVLPPTPTPTAPVTPTPTLTPTNSPTPIRTPTPTPTNIPIPTRTLTPTPIISRSHSDIDGNGCIDLRDFNEWFYAIQHGSNPRQLEFRPDINQDGSVDIIDFNAWFTSVRMSERPCL